MIPGVIPGVIESTLRVWETTKGCDRDMITSTATSGPPVADRCAHKNRAASAAASAEAVGMLLEPRPRWETRSPNRPASHELLSELAAQWAADVPAWLGNTGPIELLRTARNLFVHSWFDCDFLAVAALVAFQAMDGAFRLLAVEYDDRSDLKDLIPWALEAGVLVPDVVDAFDSSRELRNELAHPVGIAPFTLDQVRVHAANHARHGGRPHEPRRHHRQARQETAAPIEAVCGFDGLARSRLF